ncbi:MAG TPA: protein kinase [Xanthomonadales bacterium]|nr:protein kinase [Xanthomonadales bacterium]
MTQPPVSVPGYRILRPLGVGGMASVYLAVQESLDREVALKVMSPALAANEEFTERFLKEGRITAKLSHENLVTVFDIGQSGTIYYLAAEYIPGGTLRDKMAQGLSVAESLDIIRDIAMGLDYAHQKGFVHRDVKPGNVLFKANGTAVLADFGIAKSMDSKTMATQIGNSIGTPHYMSPEQARAEKVDGRSDLYALGAVLFEMLTGTPPYDANDPFTIALMHVTHPLPVLKGDVAWLQPLIEGLMAKNADDRWSTGEEFVVECEKLIAAAPEAKSIREGPQARKRAPARLTNTGRQKQAQERASQAAIARQAGGKPPAAARPAWLWPAVAAGVLLVGGVGGWLALRGGKDVPDAPPVVVASPTPAATPEPTPVESPTPYVASTPTAPAIVDLNVDGNAQADVAALLEQAREYVKVGVVENGRRLASPEGDCAVDLYKRVLTVEPDNADARAGLGQIAAFYESKAKAAYDRGMYTGAMVLAEQGLRAEEDNPSLQKLREESRQAAGM